MTPSAVGNIIFWVFLYFIIGCFALTYLIALYLYLRWFFRRSSKMPKCGNCGLKYKPTGNMAPRVLNCGHSCCGGCIKKLVGQMTWAGIIYCPFCTRSSLLNNKKWKSLVPINYSTICDILKK
ncbi:RING-type domain-containing protein [Caenorhabditis elegans]|uniref:RING-type domain-containing protein n=1 Tax=Caenorhabditis elegans TaxID=6239 RepID=C3JXE7_CAEEL|nr:RING-type domain-containing protein [Caenorhabditis elegans]CCD70943.1 RING-type domain-containing protein [Caenorhabditis elegans]|eukprot:NP_001254830.1 Uncharacterized protein CELE_F40G9.19 [Caenorhabditis elegans]